LLLLDLRADRRALAPVDGVDLSSMKVQKGCSTMARTDQKSVSAYIAAQPIAARRVLRRVRATIRRALPGATEGISYRIPFYRLGGRMVLYFAGFRHHYSIYPATARVKRMLRKELTGLVHSKGTIRFPLDEAVPTRLIARIAKLRAAEAAELNSAKRAKRARR
jgi:uncharacterized protein YdhG (YjbR/CyaY superfamily)